MSSLQWERETEGERAGMFKCFEFKRGSAEVRETNYPQYQQTASGYGGKLATHYKVRLPGSSRWHQVYCAIYSNSGTCYVCHAGKQTIVEIS